MGSLTETLMAVNIKIWNVMFCSLIDTSVLEEPAFKIKWRHIPEERNIRPLTDNMSAYIMT
jgi:hypothetical protein